MFFSFYTGEYTVPYEKTSFSDNEFSFTVDLTYVTAGNDSLTMPAFAGSSLGAPITSSLPF